MGTTPSTPCGKSDVHSGAIVTVTPAIRQMTVRAQSPNKSSSKNLNSGHGSLEEVEDEDKKFVPSVERLNEKSETIQVKRGQTISTVSKPGKIFWRKHITI